MESDEGASTRTIILQGIFAGKYRHATAVPRLAPCVCVCVHPSDATGNRGEMLTVTVYIPAQSDLIKSFAYVKSLTASLVPRVGERKGEKRFMDVFIWLPVPGRCMYDWDDIFPSES